MLKITSINGHDLTGCVDEEKGVDCKNSYPCKVDNDLKCGVGCETEVECRQAFDEKVESKIMNTFLGRRSC